MTDEIALDIQDVSKKFGATTALHSVRLQVKRGELVTLLGPSGSGKTTLLRMIVGFETPTTGTILLGGRDISRLTPADRSAGMVFQQYALFPHMTVADNIAYGLKLRRWSKHRQRQRVEEMLGLIQLSGYEKRYPRQLSGGQQQRVALARALAYEPEIVLMDEPLGALDRALRIEMEQVIRRIHRDVGATVIYVTHDQQEALSLSDRIAVMRDGNLIGVDTPEQLYYSPHNSFIASFFAGSNLIPAKLLERRDDGSARVRFAGTEIESRTSGEIRDPVSLVVRRRSLGIRESPDSVPVHGRIEETLLLGDEREITLNAPEIGTLVAVVDARDSGEFRVGQEATFHVAANETTVVPEEPANATTISNPNQQE